MGSPLGVLPVRTVARVVTHAGHPVGEIIAHPRAPLLLLGHPGPHPFRPFGGFGTTGNRIWRAQRLWSGSYFAGSVGGAPLSILRQYIEQQNRPI